MDFAIVYCVALTSYGKALYLHFYYLTIWTFLLFNYITCMYILSEIKLLLLLLPLHTSYRSQMFEQYEMCEMLFIMQYVDIS